MTYPPELNYLVFFSSSIHLKSHPDAPGRFWNLKPASVIALKISSFDILAPGSSFFIDS